MNCELDLCSCGEEFLEYFRRRHSWNLDNSAKVPASY